MKSSPKINLKARAILSLLCGLSLSDLLKLLRQIIDQVLRKVEADASCKKKPVFNLKTNFLPRHRGRKGIIESNPELKAIIDGVTDYKTYEELRQICVETIGEDQVPHKNTIARYVLKKAKQQQTGGNTHD